MGNNTRKSYVSRPMRSAQQLNHPEGEGLRPKTPMRRLCPSEKKCTHVNKLADATEKLAAKMYVIFSALRTGMATANDNLYFKFVSCQASARKLVA